MRIAIFIFFFFLTCTNLWSNGEDPSRSALMHQECMRHFTDWDKELALASADSLLIIALEEKDSVFIAKAYEIIGEMAYHDKDIQKSAKIVRLNLPILEGIGDYANLSLCIARLGNIFRHEGDLDSAIHYANLAKSYLPKIDAEKDNRPVVNIYNDLGLLYTEMGKVDSAIHYQLAMLEIIPPTDSGYLHAVHYNIARSFEMLQNYDREKEYLDRALSYCPGKKFEGSRAKVMAKIAAFWAQHGDIAKGETMIKASIELQEKSGKKEKIVQSYIVYAEILRRQKKYEEAKKALEKVAHIEQDPNLEVSSKYYIQRLTLAIETNDELAIKNYIPKAENIVGTLKQLKPKNMLDQLLAKHYQGEKKYELSNSYMQSYIAGKDSILRMESKQIALNLESKFENEKNQLQIAGLQEKESLSQKDLSRQRSMIWGGGVALCLISLVSFFLYLLYRNNQQQKNTIQKALSEKDTLLREIHHRVKNNLQLVSSLLTLQSRSITDETAIAAINDGKARVRSMALIHQDLYNKESLTGISVKGYIEKLSSEIFNTYKVDSKDIKLDLQIEDLELDVEVLVPLGLIINELLTNVLKYAFPDREEGNVTILLKQERQQLVFKMIDNGVGMNVNSYESSSSFGNRLVKILSEQLEGELKVSSNNGTQVEIILSEFKTAA